MEVTVRSFQLVLGTMADVIKTTKSLTGQHLYNISLNYNDIKIIRMSLAKNITIRNCTYQVNMKSVERNQTIVKLLNTVLISI